jgi:hypothetical protein
MRLVMVVALVTVARISLASCAARVIISLVFETVTGTKRAICHYWAQPLRGLPGHRVRVRLLVMLMMSGLNIRLPVVITIPLLRVIRRGLAMPIANIIRGRVWNAHRPNRQMLLATGRRPIR